jgi:hypothetical protein
MYSTVRSVGVENDSESLIEFKRYSNECPGMIGKVEDKIWAIKSFNSKTERQYKGC